MLLVGTVADQTLQDFACQQPPQLLRPVFLVSAQTHRLQGLDHGIRQGLFPQGDGQHRNVERLCITNLLMDPAPVCWTLQ